MYDCFNELVSYEAWDMAIQLVLEQQPEFIKGLSSLPKTQQNKIAIQLHTLIQHTSSPEYKHILEYTFRNFINLNRRTKQPFTILYATDNDINTVCTICMERFEHNQHIVYCKTCNTHIGHISCLETWNKATGQMCFNCSKTM
jgi:hypothetical protein